MEQKTHNPHLYFDDDGCDAQITDTITQTSVQVIGMGPATASVNTYLGQAQSSAILFSNMVNQQAQAFDLASASLAQEIAQLLAIKP